VKENLFVLNSEQESQGAIAHSFRKMREKDGALGSIAIPKTVQAEHS
jgi:hypothetical protein